MSKYIALIIKFFEESFSIQFLLLFLFSIQQNLPMYNCGKLHFPFPLV